MAEFLKEPGSFRDRNNLVFYGSGSVYRGLSKQAFENWETLNSKDFFREYAKKGLIIGTENIDLRKENLSTAVADNWFAFLKHQPVPFISYPYEWSFGMLKEAALLQLDLLSASLAEGMILKDSTPYNIQWQGSSPVFIDIPSFEELNSGEPWAGYRQFCEMYLFPLMLTAYKNISHIPFLRGNLEGIPLDQMNNLLSIRDYLRPGVLFHVYLHSKAQNKYSNTKVDIKSNLRESGFHKALIEANVKRLKKLVQGLDWRVLKTEWSHYSSFRTYTDNELAMKKDFVQKASATQSWKLAWDLGCNTGEFTQIISDHCEYVVGMDIDPLAIEFFYQNLKKAGVKKILPLINNVADPSPGLGWMNTERKVLRDRGKPNLVLCLALIHHIVLSANIPLKGFIQWLASLGGAVIIEYVAKDDPMVKVLLQNKEDNFSDYNQDHFENSLKTFFNIKTSQSLESGTRIIYFATPKA
jgi:SAM-dependent methyltransferase